VGSDDEFVGEVAIAFVKCNVVVENTVLIKHCERLLINYKVPRTNVQLEELPLTAARQVDRNALQERAKMKL